MIYNLYCNKQQVLIIKMLLDDVNNYDHIPVDKYQLALLIAKVNKTLDKYNNSKVMVLKKR